jgi:hypothetical protein
VGEVLGLTRLSLSNIFREKWPIAKCVQLEFSCMCGVNKIIPQDYNNGLSIETDKSGSDKSNSR